jgi:hypothetical protein
MEHDPAKSIGDPGWRRDLYNPGNQDLFGQIHTVEQIIDLDASTVQNWFDGATNGAYALPTTSTSWEVPHSTILELYKIQNLTGDEYAQIVYDNFKVEVVDAATGLTGDFDDDGDVLQTRIVHSSIGYG